MKHFVTLIISCVVCAVCHGQTMTLSECIGVGIANNLSLVNDRTGIDKARLGVTQNRSRLLPVIQGVAQATGYLKSPVNVTTGALLGNDFSDNPTWQTIKSMKYQTSAGVALNMPIYNQTILAGIDVAHIVESIQSLAYEKAREQFIVQMGKVYYLAQMSRELLCLTDANINRMSELCDITEALYDQGVVMEVDLNRVRINRERLLAERSAQSTLHEQQLNMLRYLMDRPVSSPLEVSAMDSTFVPVNNIVGANARLPEIQLAEMNKKLIDKRIRSVKAEFLPTLSLTGYLGGLGYNEKMSQFADHWFGNSYVGISLHVPVFEASSRRLRIRQYRYEASQAQNNLDLLKEQTRRCYADAALQLSRNMEIARTQAQCRKQAEQVYHVAEEQYKEGVASMTALLQDDMQLRSAQASYVQAVSQCRLAQLELQRLSGRLDDLVKP